MKIIKKAKAASGGGIENGVSWDAYNALGQVTAATLYGTDIAPFALGNQQGLTSVTFPAGIDKISSSCFSGCMALASIEIPEGVISIESNAFSMCGDLVSVTLPSSLKYIKSNAFMGCSKLVVEALPSNLEMLGDSCLSICRALRKIWIPASCASVLPTDNVWGSPFSQCDPSLVIYCEAAEKPEAWGSNWNCYNGSDGFLTVVWGTTREAFDAL